MKDIVLIVNGAGFEPEKEKRRRGFERHVKRGY